MDTIEHAASVTGTEYLSVEHAARLLDVAPVTIRRKISAGQLPAVQLGGPGSSIRIPRRALDLWLWSEGETRATR
jgi:excisionase family DNA binding protein